MRRRQSDVPELEQLNVLELFRGERAAQERGDRDEQLRFLAEIRRRTERKRLEVKP